MATTTNSPALQRLPRKAFLWLLAATLITGAALALRSLATAFQPGSITAASFDPSAATR